MKQLKKISLQNLAQDEMAKREQEMLKGGACGCLGICACLYAGPQEGPNDSHYGGSPSFAMESINAIQNGYSTKYK